MGGREGGSLEDHWRITGGSLEDHWRITGGLLEDHWRITGGSPIPIRLYMHVSACIGTCGG